MAAVAFDTLKLARKLRDTTQMSAEQAKGVAEARAEAMFGAELATKPDIRELSAREQVHFESLNERIERQAAETESRTIRWVVGVGATGFLAIVGAVASLIRDLPSY